MLEASLLFLRGDGVREWQQRLLAHVWRCEDKHTIFRRLTEIAHQRSVFFCLLYSDYKVALLYYGKSSSKAIVKQAIDLRPSLGTREWCGHMFICFKPCLLTSLFLVPTAEQYWDSRTLISIESIWKMKWEIASWKLLMIKVLTNLNVHIFCTKPTMSITATAANKS